MMVCQKVEEKGTTTYNEVADEFSRVEAAAFPEAAHRRDFEVVDLAAAWREAVDTAVRHQVPTLLKGEVPEEQPDSAGL